jgi:hypothetical protein
MNDRLRRQRCSAYILSENETIVEARRAFEDQLN